MYAAAQFKRVVQMGLLALALGFSMPGVRAQLANEVEQPYTVDQLEVLVGRVALYPDDLLAIVLPAATYPVQVVQAARFLEEYEDNNSLKSDESWDDSIIALLNYPEVVELMNTDLDWTWMLGDAVINQQSDVLEAIQIFRRRAWSAGNLNSDDRQVVSTTDEAIEITPVEKEVIYIPYYQPERVVVYQPAPVYYYYPRAYPLYYYPYPAFYSFSSGYFWGVTTAFTFGWPSHRLNVYQPYYLGHPYYGYQYRNSYTVRRHSVQRRVTFSSGRSGLNTERHQRGDQWRPGLRNGVRPARGAAADRRHRARLTDGRMQNRATARTQSRRTVERHSDRSTNLRRKQGDRNTSRRNNSQVRQSFASTANKPRSDRPGSSKRPENRAPGVDAPTEHRLQSAQKRATPPAGTSQRGHSAGRSKPASAPASHSKSARSDRSHNRQSPGASPGRSSGHRAKSRTRAR